MKLRHKLMEKVVKWMILKLLVKKANIELNFLKELLKFQSMSLKKSCFIISLTSRI